MLAKRKDFIDIAKGIGIILVVLGHLDTGGQVSREIIYSFHMPLFFLLSGLFAKTNIDFKTYLKKSALTLYLPFFVFTTIDTIISLFYFHSGLLSSIKLYFLELIGINFKVTNRPLWFLFALFVIRIVYYFIDKIPALKYISLALCFAFVLFVNLDIINPIEKCVYLMAIAGLFFYIIGSLLSKWILSLDEIIYKNDKKFTVVITSFLCIVLLVILTFTAHKNGEIDMTVFKYGNTFLYFFNAFLGIFITLLVSVIFSKINLVSKILTFYGKNSIIVLIFHYRFCRKILPLILNRLNLSDYLYSHITQVIVLALILLVMIPVILICNKYLYFIFGKKKKLVKA